VRKSIGRALHGDSANQAWGVMDVLAVTDFPDVRLKALIQSGTGGSIIIIPREGGYLFRIYVEMEKLDVGERVSDRNITADDLIAAAQRIFKPHTLDVKEVAWWSVYEIGQRLCDRFDNLSAADGASAAPHVFICGDACHTHSPKAGQGMNVSMQDAFNLGWKLAAVLQGRSAPQILRTYNDERHAIAKELLDFDREWAAMLSAPLKSADNPNGIDPAHVAAYFVRHGRYTAGTACCYPGAQLIGASVHQELAAGFRIGTRFHSAPVIRLADAKPMQLGHAAGADGRWRVFAFGSDENPAGETSKIARLCRFLTEAPASPLVRYTPKGRDIDATIDVRAIFQQAHRDVDIAAMPALLRPNKGRYGLADYEKMFCADTGGVDIFEARGVDRKNGCIVVVRPDQYVAHVLPLDGHEALAKFFDGFLLEQRAAQAGHAAAKRTRARAAAARA
jgi:phenol 2-monooxygenase